MNNLFYTLTLAVVFFLALGLMVGGIVADKHGATVIGLIVAAVSYQQWLKWKKEQAQSQQKMPDS